MDEGPKLLAPEDDEFLEIDEVISRLKEEFTVVFVDAEEGAAQIDRAIERLESQRRHAADADGEEYYAARIDDLRLERPHARFVVLADRKDYDEDYISTVLSPDSPIFFGFSSAAHEKAGLPMVERCASVLGYEAE